MKNHKVLATYIHFSKQIISWNELSRNDSTYIGYRTSFPSFSTL